jgi:hypothetical protein
VTGAVLLDTRAARDARMPRVALPVDAVVVTDEGRAFRVRGDGGLDAIVQGGRPHGGAAEDPCAGRRRSQ